MSIKLDVLEINSLFLAKCRFAQTNINIEKFSIMKKINGSLEFKIIPLLAQ